MGWFSSPFSYLAFTSVQILSYSLNTSPKAWKVSVFSKASSEGMLQDYLESTHRAFSLLPVCGVEYITCFVFKYDFRAKHKVYEFFSTLFVFGTFRNYHTINHILVPLLGWHKLDFHFLPYLEQRHQTRQLQEQLRQLPFYLLLHPLHMLVREVFVV